MNRECEDMQKRIKVYLVNSDGSIDGLNGDDNCNRMEDGAELRCGQSVFVNMFFSFLFFSFIFFTIIGHWFVVVLTSLNYQFV